MLLQVRSEGIYCERGDFYIDPWGQVDRAVITHAHSDHARWGSKHYLSTPITAALLRHRLAPDISQQESEYGQITEMNGVKVSFHPAGHIPGSAQVRVEYKGEVAVVSGDYKLSSDKISDPFEPIRCHHFVTESTFGLPIYKWPTENEIESDILRWWDQNASRGICSVILGYSLGKAQRLLSLTGYHGPVYTHGAVEIMNEVCRSAGVTLPPSQRVMPEMKKELFRKALVIATPSSASSPWNRKFAPFELAMASGWMMVRGIRRRRAIDKGFVLSDHADWQELNEAVRLSNAEEVWVTHGYNEIFSRWLNEQGIKAKSFDTAFKGKPFPASEDEEEVNS